MLVFLLALFFSSAEASTDYLCKTNYDELNIPHVVTLSVEEYYYCFGLSHGRDRAWEMDYFRRVGEGRNAEILGFSQLKSDLMMRMLDLQSMVEKIWKDFNPEKKKWIELYAQGVNEGFKTGKNSKEFKDLNSEPEAWKPEHTLLVLLLQSFDQTRKTFFRDYEEEKSKSKWGEKASQLFDEDNMPWENNILKDGEYPKRPTSTQTTSIDHHKLNLWAKFPTIFGEEAGSNSWVVSKNKSKTGKAIFANDPHLDLKTPLFWYWIKLEGPGFKVLGGSIPGVPIIASGTNGKVSWGLTNSYLNSADAFLVKDIKPEELESFRPLVYVKFWFFKIPFFFKTFERLKSIHRILPLEIESENKLVLRWSGFALRPEDIYSLFDVFKVKDVTEIDLIFSQVGVPSWNFVFADQKGAIGFRLAGKTYRHLEKTPYGIPTISLAELEQEQFLDPSERPHLLNPAREYIYTANNRHWPNDSKFYGGRGYSHSYRGFRIDELLVGKHDVESFKKIQCDQQVVDARFFLPKFQKLLNLPEFNNWNLEAEESSLVLPVYRRLFDLLIEKWEVNEYALFRLLDSLAPNKIDEMKELYHQAKSEVAGRSWGEIHRVKFPHMSKNNDWKFSPEIVGVGDSHSVNPGTSIWNSDLGIYEQTSGASMRMIVEMDETPRIWLTLPGINRQYEQSSARSPWDAWRACKYSEVKF
jgi:penicillin amidase